MRTVRGSEGNRAVALAVTRAVTLAVILGAWPPVCGRPWAPRPKGDPDSVANWVQTRFGEGKMALETIMLMIRSMRLVFEPP